MKIRIWKYDKSEFKWGNRKLFWKGIGKVTGGKAENCKRTSNRTGRMTMGEEYAQKKYLEGLYNVIHKREFSQCM